MKTIRLQSTKIIFPDACLVCLRLPDREYTIERTFTHGRSSSHLSLPVPFCDRHYEIATQKTKAQSLCERLSPVVGGFFGIGVASGLLSYWSATDHITPLLLSFPVALLAGMCLAVTLWAILLFWVAPVFASTETKQIQGSIQMTKFDRLRQVLELSFMNATAAELTARENLPLLILGADSLRQFQITAHFLDHDIRYSNTINTRVLLERAPSEKEALDLLQPVIEKIMVQQMSTGTLYDVSQINIQEALPEPGSGSLSEPA